MRNQLESLQAGDEVFLGKSIRYGRLTICSIVPISRVTPTLLIVKVDKYEVRFRKENGKVFGEDVWASTNHWIDFPITEKHHKKVEQSQMAKVRRGNIKYIADYDLNNLDNEKIAEIAHLLVNAKEKQSRFINYRLLK